MKAFAALLDRLVLSPQRNVKLRLMTDYFRETPDPDRGYALAALTGDLSIASVKPAMLRAMIAERLDEVLFAYSYDFVGDLAETIALAWPDPKVADGVVESPNSARLLADFTPIMPEEPKKKRKRRTRLPQVSGGSSPLPEGERASDLGEALGPKGEGAPEPMVETPEPPHPGLRPDLSPPERGEERPPPMGHNAPPLGLGEVVETLNAASKLEAPRWIERWLDQLDPTGRWGLIKLTTGGLRVGVSARLAKQAIADFGGRQVNEIEEMWHGLTPPYRDLFAWLEGRAAKPESASLAPFRPVMLSHAIADSELALITPDAYAAEWKWDGIRVQAVVERGVKRLYSRTGEDISGAFPDLVDDLDFEGAIDGELLIGGKRMEGFALGSFGDLQQRLNRKAVSEKVMHAFPAFLRAYDLLIDGEEDLRTLPFAERRKRLEALVARSPSVRIDVSPLVPYRDGAELASLRSAPPAEVIEGLMLKRWDSVYEPGRPKGPWFKWKRDPHTIDAVLMYAQRGHGKRSSFYSDYTFGVWRDGAEGPELVPVGKAYFGFTDAELLEIDRFVRNNTISRFGPVREVVHQADAGLVLEVAFEGLNRSSRHKSGVAMRFPRISRLRWDKPPAEADRLETLEALLRD
ncbi:MAG: cisplatin damage response ATP-dependent DNA ligase [Bauldia sp.]|nr:cisplatin damage response ATP-dependent DNA ligase [Bauldia sp.]